MATTTFTGQYSEIAYVTIASPLAVTATEAGYNVPVNYQIRGYAPTQPSSLTRRFGISLRLGSISGTRYSYTNYVSSNTANATGSETFSFDASTVFTSANANSRTASVGVVAEQVDILYSGTSGSALYGPKTVTTVNFTLNAPPTFDNTQVSFDTPFVYAGLTTASVTISNLSAKYGGNISSAVLTIGNQTATRTDNGTLSILLNAGGTFTPTITVTDSRGQKTTKSLDAITVNTYTAPSITFTAERTTSAGVADDEGEYALIPVTFTFTDAIATLQAPTVTVTDEDGITTTPTVSWRTSRSGGTVTWANVSSGDTLYGLVSQTGGFNTQKSYQINLTAKDNKGTGETETQTLAPAFYTVDFLAGGHGIAFGQPARHEGFYCDMDAHFEKNVDAPTYSVNGTAVADFIVDQGTDGMWVYRKWNSGIAECWGRVSVASHTYNANGGYYNVTGAPPTGLFVSGSNPVLSATGGITSNIQTNIGFTYASDVNIQTYLINRSASAVTNTAWVCWYLIGQWK